MESFVNRQATNINRKRLNVVDVEHDSSGNVTSLVVDEVRADSEGCTVTGTRLDKESIESAILNLIYDKIYNLSLVSQNEREHMFLVNRDDTIQITHGKSLLLYPKFVDNGGMRYFIEGAQITGTNYTCITFSFNPNYSSSYEEEVLVELYLDAAFTKFYCYLPFYITFTPSSTGSGD